MDKKICIKLTDIEYKRLKKMALDIEPEIYLHKIVHMHLTADLHDSKDEKDLTEEEDEFYYLQQSMNQYNITQTDIANYFKVTQQSVSTFIKHKNKKSNLYPKFFIHPSSISIFFDIYLHKYIAFFEEKLKESEQFKISSYLREHKYSGSQNKLCYILISRMKMKNKHLNIDIVLNKLNLISIFISNLEINIIKKKDIKELHKKIEFLLEKL